jgi:hypothetical protein
MRKITLTTAFVMMALFISQAVPAQRQLVGTVKVRLIQATAEGEEKTDPALADIEEQLHGVFKYKNYTLLDQGTGLLSAGKTLRLKMAKSNTLHATLNHVTKGYVDLHLRWTQKESEEAEEKVPFNTKVKIQEGKTMLLGGPKSDGGVLILAVTAK